MPYDVRRLLPAVFVVGLVGCGDAANVVSYATFAEACAAVPGCGEARFPISGTPEPVIRVVVARAADGTVSVAKADAVMLTAGDGIPMGPPDADVLLVGRYASGEVVDGQRVFFPRTRIVETFGADAPPVEESLADESTSAVGYVRWLPDVADIAVVDLDGEVIATGELPPAPTVPAADPRALVATTAPACAHVIVLDGEKDRALLPEAYPLVTPSPIHLALIDATLGRLKPVLCHGVSRIALVDLPEDTARGFVAAVAGDVIHLNVGYVEGLIFKDAFYDAENLTASVVNQIAWQGVLTHEIGHVLDFLMTPAGASVPTRVASRSLADRTLAKVRIPEGLRASWEDLHQRFVDEDMAEDYAFTEERRAYTNEKIARAGNMSKYGSTKISDDIAEMVAWLVMGAVYDANAGDLPADERQDLGCMAMQTYTEGGVPGRYAALYTKMRFLGDLDVVSAADIARCSGPGVGLTETAAHGFTFSPASADESLFTTSPSSALDAEVYTLSARGSVSFDDTTFPAEARLRLHPTVGPSGAVAFPRGIYAIDAASVDEFRVIVEDRPAASFVVSEGFVLVASASTTRILGSIFITEGLRYDAPVPVPQVFDPPLIIAFSDDAPPQ